MANLTAAERQHPSRHGEINMSNTVLLRPRRAAKDKAKQLIGDIFGERAPMVFVQKYKDMLMQRGPDKEVTIQEFDGPVFRTFLTDLLESYMTDIPFLRLQLNVGPDVGDLDVVNRMRNKTLIGHHTGG